MPIEFLSAYAPDFFKQGRKILHLRAFPHDSDTNRPRSPYESETRLFAFRKHGHMDAVEVFTKSMFTFDGKLA